MLTYVDPVCGMTVGESALKADGFDDVAFCAPGCRTAFLADPSAYGPVDSVTPRDPMPETDSEHDH